MQSFFLSNPQASWLPTPFPRELLQIVSVSSPDWTCITNIHTAVTFSTKGLAGSTQRSYQAGQKRYLAFCSEVHRPALPTSEATLSMFVSYLAHEGLAHSTIKVDLSAIRNLHVSAGLHEEFSNQLTPRLELVPLNATGVYIRLIFTSRERERRIYTPAIYSGPYRANRRSLAAVRGKTLLI